ncbi:Uncharacterised protein [Enterobacter cancerogenus]|uniref:Uncharacterized protein n=1 Tax=Enterobacter cancerogenus TaxID=69218 RepID=A0A484YW23_9ENTR|nr:Uncharacterised protein [Enterobacter cancerogenus]
MVTLTPVLSLVFQPRRRVMHQDAQGIKLAGVLQFQALQHLTQGIQMFLRLVELAQIRIR